MRNHKPLLLVVADAAALTGFGRLASSLLCRFVDDFEVHHLGLGYRGPETRIPGWQLHPCAPQDGRPNLGLAELPGLMRRLRPALVLVINDLDAICSYAEILRPWRGRTRFAAYFPVDSDPVESAILRPVLDFCQLPVTYTGYARAQVLDTLQRDRLDFDRDAIAVIPHGVDQQKFRPLHDGGDRALADSRLEARRTLFPGHPELDDAFIFLNANRNQPRKRIDATIEGFAMFAERKPPEVRLYLHMGCQDSGWNLGVLARRHGIEERLILSTTGPEMPAVSVQRLNLIYNACDVGINTSTAEGWGLCAFEHAATGHAQVVPGHTALRELWENIGVCIPPSFVTTSEGRMTRAYHLSPCDIAEAFERLYADDAHRDAVARRCFQHACDPRFSWDNIAADWRRRLQELLA